MTRLGMIEAKVREGIHDLIRYLMYVAEDDDQSLHTVLRSYHL